MNDRLRLKVAIMAICFVSLISKGIVLERLTHKNDLLDVYPSFNIQNVDIKKTELEESLKMIMDKAALSKYFKNFSIQFVKTNYCKEPIIIVIDLRSVFENKEKPIGLYCSDHQQYFFIKEDSNRLWEKYFSYSGSEESVELRQIIVPDSVYIMEPDVSFVCVAKIEGNLCKILYCEIDGKIDGKIDEADEAAEEAEPANFSLPVGGIIDEPIELEPAYTTLMTRDYCGNYIYCNGTLERILTGNGYILGGEYYFYIKDYQGNIRVVLNQNNQPIELNSYYPYGGLMGAATMGVQPHKYGAKELDRENGLDLYDSHARQLDSTVPHFIMQDNKAENYYSVSPYMYCSSNPLKYIDPDGNDIAVLHYDGEHIALLISQDNKSWYYFSINGNNVYSCGSGTSSPKSQKSGDSSFSGGGKTNDVHIGPFRSVSSFLDSEYNRVRNGYNYDKAFVIKTTSKEAKIVEDKFTGISKTKYSLNPLSPNHCGTAVQKSLESIGVETKSTEFYSIDPMTNIYGIKKNESIFPKFVILQYCITKQRILC